MTGVLLAPRSRPRCIRWISFGVVLGLLLVMSIPAGAVKPADAERAQKITWYAVSGGSSDYVLLGSPIPGHVNLNTPSGDVTMVINGVITLAPNTTYAVWIREFTGYTGDWVYSYPPLKYYALGYFTTDGDGNGSFHFNIREGDLTPDTRDIQLAINTTPVIGATVAATEKYTVVTNS